MSPRRIVALALAGIVLLAILLSLGQLLENLDAKQVMVIQSPVKGQLDWYTSQGVKWQGFGKVTCYDRRSQFWFSAKKDQGQATDSSTTADTPNFLVVLAGRCLWTRNI